MKSNMELPKHIITEEEFANHDCKLSSEDSCQTCYDYFMQKSDAIPETIALDDREDDDDGE